MADLENQVPMNENDLDEVSGGGGGFNDFVYYTVVKGDTLTRIAHRFHSSVDAIAAMNGIQNKNFIRIGQVLKIPVRV